MYEDIDFYVNFPKWNRRRVSRPLYLPGILFLTMSNLTFLLPILLAFKRRLYTESLTYSINMLFSIVWTFFNFDSFNYRLPISARILRER